MGLGRLGGPLALLGAIACGLPDSDYFGRVDRVQPGHFRWCNQGEPDFLDPARASSTASAPLVTTMFDGLTTYDLDGLPIASLATHWEIADDFRTFTFHLRDTARWSNGRAVTAYDVAFSAIRVSHPLTASPNGDTIAPIKNVTGYLTRTVFRLARAIAPYRAGEIVELVGDPPVAIDPSARTARVTLALRDLGAEAAAGYARVPSGTTLTLIATSGTTITPPSPADGVWAYVYWERDAEGVFGWVPASELVRPATAATVQVRRVLAKQRPSFGDAASADDESPTVAAQTSDLEHTPSVLGIRVSDPYTIAFETTDPTPFFLAATNNRALRTTPTEAVSRWPQRWTRPEHIVTSGPLHLTAWHDRDRLEFVRSPTYWNPGEVKHDRLTVYSMDDQAATTNYYYTGNCDATATNTVPSSYLPVLSGEHRGRPYKDYDVSPYLGVYFLWVNQAKVQNRHLRRALAFAVDRTQVPKFTHGGEIPTAQLTPGTPIARLGPADLAACGVTRETPGVALVMTAGELCYVPPPGLDFDLALARQEIALARQEGGVPAKLHYIYNAGSEAHKQIAEYLQAAWRQIGVDVELEAREWNAMLEATKAGDYEIARLGNIGNIADTESEFLPLFKCNTPDNRGRYCNAEFERLLGEARTMRDRKARNAKLREAEAVMINDVPVIPIYVYTQKQLVKPYVRDYAINLIGHPPLWRAWVDPAWRPR